MVDFFVSLKCVTTVCIRIVADFGSRIFQFTTNVDADYNAHIYCYFGYYFYTLLWVCALFFRLIIKKIIPIKKRPIPNNKQIVLIGCPSLAVQAKAFSTQPKMIVKIESDILVPLFI